MNEILEPLAAGAWASLILALLHTMWIGALAAALLAVALKALPANRPNARYGAAALALAAVVAGGLCAWVILEAARLAPAHVTNSEGGGALFVPPIEMAAAPMPAAPALALPWTAWAAAFWLAGAAAMLARIAWLVVETWRDRGQCRPLNDPLIEERFAALMGALKIARRVRLLITEKIDSPAVAGVLWPAILLPASILTGASPAQLEAILAHELAHIRRHDYLIHLLQLAAEALLFFNPAVWWISRRMRVEREACCDDLAARTLGERLGYARALSDVVARLRLSVASPRADEALNGDGEPSELLDRVRRIVLPHHRPRLRLPLGTFLVSVALSVLVLGGLWRGTEAFVAAAGEATGDNGNTKATSIAPVDLGIDKSEFATEFEPEAGKDLTIAIHGDGAIQFNGAQVTLDQLESRLTSMIQDGDSPTDVIIRADAHASIQPMSDVIGLLKKLNLESFNLDVTKQSPRTAEATDLTLEVFADGTIKLDSNSTTIAELDSQLTSMRQTGRNTQSATIRGGADVSYTQVIRVIEVLRKHNVQSLLFDTMESAGDVRATTKLGAQAIVESGSQPASAAGAPIKNIPATPVPTPKIDRSAVELQSRLTVPITIETQPGDTLADFMDETKKDTGLNYFIASDADTDINANFPEIPLRELLDIVLPPMGLGWTVGGDAIVIAPREELDSIRKVMALRSYNVAPQKGPRIKALLEAAIRAGDHALEGHMTRMFLQDDQLIVSATPEVFDKIEKLLKEDSGHIRDGKLKLEHFDLSFINAKPGTPELKQVYFMKIVETIQTFLYAAEGMTKAALEGRKIWSDPDRFTITLTDYQENIEAVGDFIDALRDEKGGEIPRFQQPYKRQSGGTDAESP